MSNNDNVKHLIEKYQCPGCSCGGDTTSCDDYKESECCYNDSGACGGHYPGTMMLGVGSLYLGLPRGMDKVGDCPPGRRIRIWPKGSKGPGWNIFNIPIWYVVDDGNLIVKTVLPRRMEIFIDIIECGKPEMVTQIPQEEFMRGDLVGEVEGEFQFVPFNAKGVD